MFKKLVSNYIFACGVFLNILAFAGVSFFFVEVFRSSANLPQAFEMMGEVSRTSRFISFLKPVFLTLAEKVEDKPKFVGDLDKITLMGKGAKKFKLPILRNLNSGRLVIVNNTEELRKSIQNAQPGDNILLEQGVYRLTKQLKFNKPGTLEAPIHIASDNLGDVTIEVDAQVGFSVSNPNYSFENLFFVGKCEKQWHCEHAMHITNKAENVKLYNNVFKNFDSAIKINGVGGVFPDNGEIVGNTIFNTTVRDTKNPVTPIDLVGANDWMIVGNYIHSFEKGFGNRVSYGIFVKGGSQRGTIKQNVLMCSPSPQNRYTAIGISAGGGGTDKNLIRNNVTYENFGAQISHNFVLNCSDVGIYVNKSREVTIHHNLLYGTMGIDVRFEQSEAKVFNNILSGKLRTRDDAKIAYQNSNIVFNRSFIDAGDDMTDNFENAQEANFRVVKSFKENGNGQSSRNETSDFCGQNVPKGTVYFGPVLEQSWRCVNGKN